jgi:hypothetical protein
VGIKLVHSAVWLFMVTCILSMPLAAVAGRFTVSAILAGVVLLECAVLAVNKGTCPLTSIAALYTEDRADNFDIYLPIQLARHNKTIFGLLFVFGGIFTVIRWLVVSR